MKPLHVAALVKQIPKFEVMALGPDGRLQRDGVELSMNPYCQRALSKGIELAQATGGQCTVISLGPAAAADVVRWGVAAGADRGILISDPAFAGSDTLATARALAEVIEHGGPFDLILVGKNAVDADTGQVGPELAELLGLPFAAAVRSLELRHDRMLYVGCEHDDAWVEAEVPLPAVISTAERLCRPAKVDDPDKAAVPAEKIRTITSADLGNGPWGVAGSPTWVGETKVLEVKRERRILSGALQSQVAEAMALLGARRAFEDVKAAVAATVGEPVANPVATIAVLIEPGNTGSARELLGAAAQMAPQIGARVAGVLAGLADDTKPEEFYSWGADHLCVLEQGSVEEDIAHFVASWCHTHSPRCLFAPSTSWGREVASRVAARTGSGLTGDAIALEYEDQQLVSWKPAFGGRLVAAIRSTSAIQMATVRPGVLPRPSPREPRTPSIERHRVEAASRVRVVSRQRNDQLDSLAMASRVVGVGMGIPPERYPELDPMLAVLGAELATTRKVTDKGWLPHARQVGITGRSIAPDLYIGIAVSGNFNHTCGIQAAGTVMAINSDPQAAIFEHADIGIVADWADSVPLLVKAFGDLLPNAR
jgi:electron transfer flavoprotein alpha subunit